MYIYVLYICLIYVFVGSFMVLVLRSCRFLGLVPNCFWPNGFFWSDEPLSLRVWEDTSIWFQISSEWNQKANKAMPPRWFQFHYSNYTM